MSFFKQSKKFPIINADNLYFLSVIRGNMPRVGDRVMVEASYNASMPFKWNAYRIQLLPNDNVQQMQRHSAPVPQDRMQNGIDARWSGHIDLVRDRSPIGRDRLPPRRALPPRGKYRRQKFICTKKF